VLRAYGYRTPEGLVASSTEEAVEAAERVGYPVALKLLSPDVRRKTAVGGVRTDLASPDQVRDAFDLMVLRVRHRSPRVRIDGVYVEKMCHRRHRVSLGMERDPRFGPMLMLGMEDSFVEVMKDVTFYLAPITAEEAMQMLRGTRAYERLVGRGEREVNLDSVAVGLQRLSQLSTDFSSIRRVEISPFMFGRVESDAVAVDARFKLIDTGKR
jgi:acetate---CoA ligase (ADP-forming)